MMLAMQSLVSDASELDGQTLYNGSGSKIDSKISKLQSYLVRFKPAFLSTRHVLVLQILSWRKINGVR